MHRDRLEIDHPPEEPRFMLNGIHHEGSYVNEPGNRLVSSLPGDVVGRLPLDGDKILLFLTNGTNSFIGIQEKDTYTSLIEDTNASSLLNFQLPNWVKGTWRVTAGSQRVIYFVDTINPDRSINLDDLSRYVPGNPTNPSPDSAWNTDEFALTSVPAFTYLDSFSVQDGGGIMELGTYRFAVEVVDEDLNRVQVTSLGPEITIYDDRVTGSYETIDGGYNIELFDAASGGVPRVNKSVSFTIQNLDIEQDFFRLITYRRSQGQFGIFEVYQSGELQQIQSNQQVYLFTGISVNDSLTSLEDVVTPNVVYNRSGEVLAVDRRLVRMNTREETRDYSGYQQACMGISSRYIARVAGVSKDNSWPHDPKNPLVLANGPGFMPDEIYAIGIRYVFQDGTRSPVFHVPGREASGTDRDLLTVIAAGSIQTPTQVPLEQVRHLGFSATTDDIGYGPGLVPRWRVFNTAGVTNELVEGRGAMSFHESYSGLVYPSILDANSLPVFGTSTGQPVRYHRFPSTHRVRNVSDGTARVVLGLELTGIPFPDTDIAGYEITRARAFEKDITVLGSYLLWKGVNTTSVSSGDDVISSGYTITDPGGGFTYNDTNLWGFYMQNRLQGVVPLADHLTVQGTYSPVKTPSAGTEFELPDGRFVEYRRRVSSVNFRFNSEGSDPYIRSIDELFGLGPYAQQGSAGNNFDEDLFNLTNNPCLFVHLQDALPATVMGTNADRVAITGMFKANLDPYQDFFTLTYFPILLQEGQVSSIDSFHGDTFINEFNDASILLEDLVGANRATTSVDGILQLGLYDLYFHDRVNASMRHPSTTTSYLQFFTNTEQENLILLLFSSSDQTGSLTTLERPGQESDLYNSDYTSLLTGTAGVILPVNHDYTNSVNLGIYPNRVVWSNPYNVNQRADAWRVTQVNNFTEIGQSTGEIINASYSKQTLLVRTRKALWYTQPVNRQLSTDAETVFIGSGEFLGAPAYEYAAVSQGFGGCQHRLAELTCEHGDLWVDGEAGRVFLWGGQGLVELSTTRPHGLSIYLRAFLPGARDIHLLYDPVEERAIMHKYGAGFDINNLESGEHTFGLSFSFRYNKWASFHGWVPYAADVSSDVPTPGLAWSDSREIYSVLNRECWRHDQVHQGLCSFYGNQQDFVIEYIVSDPVTNELQQLTYYAITRPENSRGSSEQLRFPTFSRMIAYSRDQSTNIQLLTPKAFNSYEQAWSFSEKSVAMSEKNYRVTGLANLAQSTFPSDELGFDVFSEDWNAIGNQIRFSPGKQGYTDRAFTDFSGGAPSQWGIIPLKNKYHYIRLFFSDPNPLSFDLLSTIKMPSDL